MNRPLPDHRQALAWAVALFADEPTEFRLIHPHSGRAVSLWGRLERLSESLSKLNRADYGIYAVVNRLAATVEDRVAGGNGAAGDKDVTGIRAVFVEIDREDEQPGSNLQRLQNAPLPPSLIVRSSLPHRLHAYWITPDLPVSEFRTVQKHLAKRFAGDLACQNPSRLMRVPGFLHTKGQPIRSELLKASRTAYTREELLSAFAIDPTPPQPSSRPVAPVGASAGDSTARPPWLPCEKSVKPWLLRRRGRGTTP
jgi:hypothetical protein